MHQIIIKKLGTSALILSLIVLSTLSSFAQKPLFKLGSHKYYTEEFEYYFSKNNDRLSKDSVAIKVNEYLELFVKFRLKVLEARQKDMHLEPDFIKEFTGYQKQLAKPYLMESKMSEALVQEVYARMLEEVKASHILLRVAEDAVPEDTLKAFNKIINIKAQITAGASFDSLAVIHSEDPSAKQNKGSLGYFSAMAMVFPFEDAAYNTAVGALSNPVRTKFGYHLIKVQDRRKARGKVKVAHIMLRSKPKASPEEAQNVEAKINSIYDKLTKGASWDELCKLYSEDQNTKDKGGVLNWFGTGNLVKEFETAAFGLENKGDYSKVFQTRYGWHIVKLMDKKPVEPLDEIRTQLESKISRDGRSKVKKTQSLQKLKKQNNFQISTNNRNTIFTAFDSTLIFGKWKLDSATFINQVLFSLKDNNYSTWDFAAFVLKNQRRRKNISIAKYAESLYNQFEEKSIFEFEEKNLEYSNKEYRMILQEYRDGILLFNLMEQEVWGKAVSDTTGQKEYYSKFKNKYAMKESAVVRVLSSENKETIEKVKADIDKTKKEIDKAYNSKERLTLQILDKTVEKGEDSDVDSNWAVGIYEYEKGGRHYLLQVKEIIAAGYKVMENIKGQVISDYQNHLEDQWIEGLKDKYPVKVNKATLKLVIKKIEAQL